MASAPKLVCSAQGVLQPFHDSLRTASQIISWSVLPIQKGPR